MLGLQGRCLAGQQRLGDELGQIFIRGEASGFGLPSDQVLGARITLPIGAEIDLGSFLICNRFHARNIVPFCSVFKVDVIDGV